MQKKGLLAEEVQMTRVDGRLPALEADAPCLLCLFRSCDSVQHKVGERVDCLVVTQRSSNRLATLHQRIRKQRRDAKTQQLLLTYRGSTLAPDDPKASGRLQAGDRAPDASCQDAMGSFTRLFDVFRGSYFTLLAFGGDQVGMVAEANNRYESG